MKDVDVLQPPLQPGSHRIFCMALNLCSHVQVSFYGLHMDALMGAHIFEEAYNIVLHMGEKAYGRKGKPQSILDYRCAATAQAWQWPSVSCSCLAQWPARPSSHWITTLLTVNPLVRHIAIAWVTS
jgi:hypothetical protein